MYRTSIHHPAERIIGMILISMLVACGNITDLKNAPTNDDSSKQTIADGSGKNDLNEDLNRDSEADDQDPDLPEKEICDDLTGVPFDQHCPDSLGWGVKMGDCYPVFGCDALGYTLFEDKEACLATCNLPSNLCLETGGEWDANSSSGHYLCGQKPAETGLGPGRNRGREKNFDERDGCVPADCVPPSCEDIGEVNFNFKEIFDIDDYPRCESRLGWAVAYGACQMVYGCPDMDYGFYATQEACNEACHTLQRTCMSTGGVWMGDAASIHQPEGLLDVQKCYQCGIEIPDCTATPPCNCGPNANYVDDQGCVPDDTCPEPRACSNFDFKDYVPNCGPEVIDHLGIHGLVDGQCELLLSGCAADFQGDNPVVDPGDWFDSVEECEAACAPRCQDSAECGEGEFCKFEFGSNCGLFTGGGICSPSGGVCGGSMNPVCGCDGNYISTVACIDAHGRSMAYHGECIDDPSFFPEPTE